MDGKTNPPPPRNRGKSWLVIGLACLLGWVGFIVVAGPLVRSGGLQVPALEPLGGVPRSAEFRWTLLDPADKPVEFSSFKGRPIVLNLWATWCGPCLEEMPSIAALAANPEIKARKIAVVCISTDDTAEALRKFVKDKNWEMTILRATSIPPVFQTDGIPATFLITPEGKIATAEVGAARWDDPSVVTFLSKLAR